MARAAVPRALQAAAATRASGLRAPEVAAEQPRRGAPAAALSAARAQRGRREPPEAALAARWHRGQRRTRRRRGQRRTRRRGRSYGRGRTGRRRGGRDARRSGDHVPQRRLLERHDRQAHRGPRRRLHQGRRHLVLGRRGQVAQRGQLSRGQHLRVEGSGQLAVPQRDHHAQLRARSDGVRSDHRTPEDVYNETPSTL